MTISSDETLEALADQLASKFAHCLLSIPQYFGHFQVIVGKNVILNNAFFNLACGNITLEDFAFLGHNTSLITGTHDTLLKNHARQAAIPSSGRDIIIGGGAFLGANSTIIGPCRIGQDAVVDIGSVVVNDLEAGWIYSGVPARPIKKLT